jgi:hypothetical protein
MKTKALFAAAFAAILIAAGASAGAEARYGTHDQRLTGPRYQTMLLLAVHLDSTAQGALEGAVDETRRGSAAPGRFLAEIRAFARSTGAFHRMMDAYPGAPFEVPPRVSALSESARRVSARLHTAAVLKSTYDDWGAVIDVLGRMTLVLAGGEVGTPTAYVVPALAGVPLDQFRLLARALDLSASGAHEQARRQVSAHRARGPQLLGELGYFAARSRELRTRSDSGDVYPLQMGILVDRLLEEARAADRTMREAAVFSGIWDDSGRTITILEQMARLVRS